MTSSTPFSWFPLMLTQVSFSHCSGHSFRIMCDSPCCSRLLLNPTPPCAQWYDQGSRNFHQVGIGFTEAIVHVATVRARTMVTSHRHNRDTLCPISEPASFLCSTHIRLGDVPSKVACTVYCPKLEVATMEVAETVIRIQCVYVPPHCILIDSPSSDARALFLFRLSHGSVQRTKRP